MGLASWTGLVDWLAGQDSSVGFLVCFHFATRDLFLSVEYSSTRLQEFCPRCQFRTEKCMFSVKPCLALQWARFMGVRNQSVVLQFSGHFYLPNSMSRKYFTKVLKSIMCAIENVPKRNEAYWQAPIIKRVSAMSCTFHYTACWLVVF